MYSIIDAALLCHVGFVQDGLPCVIPTLHARDDDRLLLHGSSVSRIIKHLSAGNLVCVTITLVDGLVMARSVFNHSVNYRSVVIFGRGEAVIDADEKLRALHCFMERQVPGRWADARQPDAQELKATGVVSISLSSASAKVRVGPPKDAPEDMSLPVWAGVLPLHPQPIGEPVPAVADSTDPPLPAYLKSFIASRRNGS